MFKEVKLGRPKKNMFETAEENSNMLLENPTEVMKICSLGQPGWTDHIMSLLTDSEKKDGYPKTEGLRRIAHLKLGEIIKSNSKVAVEPSFENMLTTIVEHTLVIFDGEKEKEFTAVGEASPHHLEEP